MIYQRVYGTVPMEYWPWEWREEWRGGGLRNVLFLEFYAIPLRVIKFFHLDSNTIVRYYSYIL